MKLVNRLLNRKNVAVLAAALTVGIVASGCDFDWLDGGTVFTSGSAGGFGLGCFVQSCDWLSGNYITVTLSHSESHELLSVGEGCINSNGLPGTCMPNIIDPLLGSVSPGPFVDIEANAMLDSNCLYDSPPAGWCTSGYGTYGVSLYHTLIAYGWQGYDASYGCIGFRVNLLDVNYQQASWFYTGSGGGGDAPGGSECQPQL